jgi:hypothetical protein
LFPSSGTPAHRATLFVARTLAQARAAMQGCQAAGNGSASDFREAALKIIVMHKI